MTAKTTASAAVSPAMTSAEQAADLAALSAFADNAPIVPGTPEAEAAQAQASRPDLATEIAGLTSAFIAIAAPILPSLPAIYTPEATQAAATALAAVCDKHGWLQSGVMGDYGEEIAALVVCGPLAFATVQAVRHDLAANKEKNDSKGKTKAIAQAEPAQSISASGDVNQKTVIIGTPQANANE